MKKPGRDRTKASLRREVVDLQERLEAAESSLKVARAEEARFRHAYNELEKSSAILQERLHERVESQLRMLGNSQSDILQLQHEIDVLKESKERCKNESIALGEANERLRKQWSEADATANRFAKEITRLETAFKVQARLATFDLD